MRRLWKYAVNENDASSGVKCTGCGQFDENTPTGTNPFARFDSIEHTPGCPYADISGWDAT